jgi:phosphoglycolate phosphatase-like HAD superfamily hydrolase
MTPRLFIFDVEGTLINCVQQSLICWRDALASHGYDFSIEELHRHSGRDPDDMLRILLPQAEARRLAKPLKDMQGACYRERYLAAVRPFPDVRALFEEIKQSAALIALATTCSKDELGRYMKVAEASDLVDHVACGEDVAHEKPHPDLIQLALARAKASPADAVMFGDTPYDAQAALAADVTPIGVLSGGFSKAELETAGCAAVYSDTAALLKAGLWSRIDAERARAAPWA